MKRLYQSQRHANTTAELSIPGRPRARRFANTLKLMLALATVQTASADLISTSSSRGDGATVVRFTGGSGVWTVPTGVTSLEVLMVGGGGAGGYSFGGGGGAGGLISNASYTPGASLSITVGAGGIAVNGAGGRGEDSVLDSLTAYGGGYGGGVSYDAGTVHYGPLATGDNGSAGGFGDQNQGTWPAGTYTASQGNAAGSNTYSGGGGAGGAGNDGTAPSGVGGLGLSSSITGTATFYAAGGGGLLAAGGSGIGGNSLVSGAATGGAVNTGSGGGGGWGGGALGGNGGSGIVIVTYTPPTTQPPVWAIDFPKADPVTSIGFTARAKTDKDGNAYYVVLNHGPTIPTSTDVKNGTGALQSGSIVLTANTENTAVVTGLTTGTAYDVWFVAEDTVPILQADPVKVSITTTTVVWATAFPKADPVTSIGFTARAKTDKDGNAYYVVLDAGSPSPTSTDVKNGTGALKSGTIPLTANTENTAVVTGLTPGTAYDVWFVAEDTVPILQADPVKVSITTTVLISTSSSRGDGATVVRFTGGSGVWTVPAGVTSLEVLVIGGGGAGGHAFGGGGGAGGFISNASYTPGASLSITVGAGGIAVNGPGGRGGDSVLDSLIAYGGGYGGGVINGDPAIHWGPLSSGSNGSAGGFGDQNQSYWPAGTFTASQGNAAGSNTYSGGGGAGGAGNDGTAPSGVGGLGLSSSITGTATFYAAGGGGLLAAGGSGIGGNGGNNSPGTDGAVNTGSGGGGGFGGGNLGGNGGSGIVIVTYSTATSPYDSWVGPFFPGVIDPLIVGQAADPDGDNQNNLMEFALGGTPNNGALNGKVYSYSGIPTQLEYPQTGTPQKVLILTIAVRDGTADFTSATEANVTDGIRYTVEGGTTLNSWTGGIYPFKAASYPELPSLAGTGYHYQSFVLTGTEGLPDKGFMRVKVEPAP